MQDLETGREGSFSGETVISPKQEIPRTSGRGLAVRFGPASWASLVIEFCRQGGFYLLAERFPSVVCFCRLGMDYLLPEKFPSLCVFKRCICRGVFRLEETRKQRSAFSKALHCFRTFYSNCGSPANPTLLLSECNASDPCHSCRCAQEQWYHGI